MDLDTNFDFDFYDIEGVAVFTPSSTTSTSIDTTGSTIHPVTGLPGPPRPFGPPRTPQRPVPDQSPLPSPVPSTPSPPPSPVPSSTPGTPDSNSVNMADLQRLGGHFDVDAKTIRFSGNGLHNKPAVGTFGRTSFCYRPDHTDLKSFQANEKACTKPLDEALRLEVEPTKKGPTFTRWLKDIERHFLKHGLDSTLYVLKPRVQGTVLDITSVADTTEYNLLNQWGQVKQEDIMAFNTAVLASPCPIEQGNNNMACEFLKDSVSLDFKSLLDQDLPIVCSAAWMFWAIIQKVQGTNSTAGRDILHKIEVLRLTSQPGYDVDTFSTKLHTMCTNLAGLGENHLPMDFSVLICSCFDTTGVPPFDLEMVMMSNDLDNNPNALTWNEIITKARAKFNTLKTTRRWPPLLNGGKSKAAESGFAVELKTLQGKVGQLLNQSKPNGGGGGGGPKDYSQDTSCRYCKEKDHIVTNCPKLAAKNKENKHPGGGGKKPPMVGSLLMENPSTGPESLLQTKKFLLRKFARMVSAKPTSTVTYARGGELVQEPI